MTIGKASIQSPLSVLDRAVVPHSLEAEQSVLGGVMLVNSAWDQIADRINAQDFYHPGHQKIFIALSDLVTRKQPLDILTLKELLKDRNQLEQTGGEVYLFELTKNTPSAANVVAYADIVRERSVLRQLINVASEITTAALQSQGRESADILDEAERKIFAIANQNARNDGPEKISKILSKTLNRIDALFQSQEPITGIATRYHDLDKMTAGLQRGDLIIIAGRPSMGKTALALNLAEHAIAKEKKAVLVFSMEMSAEQLAMRLISSLARIDQQKLRTGRFSNDDWPRITSTVNILSASSMYIDDTPALSPIELCARARRVAREHDELGLVIVDYLQLMHIAKNIQNRAIEIAEISRALKSLAKELHVPVVALSQLNRGLEQRADKRPLMSDLRESGSLEQDADVIMFIYRDEVYNDQSPDKNTAEIIIGKQRNGPTGKVRLTFLAECIRFENFSADEVYIEKPPLPPS